jgi:hypothetical protein
MAEFLLLLELWQKHSTRILHSGMPKLLSKSLSTLVHLLLGTDEVMGSDGSSSLPCIIKVQV